MNEYIDEIVIEMLDQNKKMHFYELLDIIIYNDSEYAVMVPRNTLDSEVEIFKIKHTDDKTTTIYTPETNMNVIMNVYELFKENYQQNYPGRIKFED